MSTIPTTLVYQHGQAESLIAIILFSTISAFAIIAVFAVYSWEPLVSFVRRQHRTSETQGHSRAFFHTQLGAYIASLMVSNAFSSVSMMVNAEWAAEKVVTEGTLCNTQGILALIGDTGGAYFTSAIAIHTFNTLVLRNKLSKWVCAGINIFGWLTAILIAATPTWIHSSVLGSVYGLNGVSCGISVTWPIANTGLHLLPLLLGSIVSVVFYTLIFLVLRGTLTINDGIKLNFNRSHRWSMSSVTTMEYQRFIAAVARSMLWYPFAYNILLLPEIIVSLTQSSGIQVPFGAGVFADTASALLGLANALILINTLRILRPFLEGNGSVGGGSSIKGKAGKDADMESFFAGAKSPMGFVSPSTPKNPEKAFISRVDSKREWTPPPRTASNPAASVGASVARGIERISRTVSLKRKEAPQPIARPITPVSELNAMITVTAPEPAFRKNTLPSTPRLRPSPGLPAPPRDNRSPVIRRPTLPTEPSPVDAPFQTISLSTPEPPKKALASPELKEGGSRHTSASESLVSMYLSRTPEQEEMDKPAPPPKPLSVKPRPQPMPLSARPPMTQNSLAPSPLPSLRSARPMGYIPEKSVLASNEWAGSVWPTTATLKAERRRSRSLDLNAANIGLPRTPAMSARTPMYGDSLTAATPRRDASLTAVSARTPTSARRLPPTPSQAGNKTPGGYGYL